MPEFITLDATKRTVIGKQVKQLRRQGLIPAVVYGQDTEPIHLTIDARELRQVLLEAGGTQIIEIHVDGKKIPTLAREVQRNPLGGDILHVDFYQVSMNRPIRAEVPVLIVGENELVDSGAAMVLHVLNALTVEALPADLPASIDVDISELKEIGDQITIGDLTLPAGCTVINDPDELLVKLEYARIEEEEEVAEELLVEESPEVEVIREAREDEEVEE